MLAYLFWHRPRTGVSTATYEEALLAFQHSLASRPPAGLLANASVRLPDCPWLGGGRATGAQAGGYEDWYVVEDWTAVGVLEQAAVGAGHRSRHDRVAGIAGAGAGAVYRLLEGDLAALSAPSATWVQAPACADRPAGVADLLADGADRERAALWQRTLVLGPAPEHCLLAAEAPAGVAASRLPPRWSALTLRREPLFSG